MDKSNYVGQHPTHRGAAAKNSRWLRWQVETTRSTGKSPGAQVRPVGKPLVGFCLREPPLLVPQLFGEGLGRGHPLRYGCHSRLAWM